MNTNFFTALAAMQVQGSYKMAIHVDAQNELTVSLLFNTAANGDKASKTVPPMCFKGTAIELDEHFFNEITKPVQETSALFINMEAYVKSLEEAKKQSKQEQDKKDAEKKAKAVAKPAATTTEDIEVGEPKPDPAEKRRTYEEAMKKIAELNDACKYAEALELLPTANDYPEKQAELDRKRTDLTRKKEQHDRMLDLFKQSA